MVNSRTEATLAVVGLEKAIAKMENFMLEFRASRASPLMTFPTFDGSGALAWLARANQYFLVNKTPSDRRVDVAMIAIDGPAKPWKQLLVRRCPSLSWDRFVQELLNRFGDTTAPGGTPPMTLPTFDGSDAIAWLARAEQYFLVSKIPPENRLSVAMVALAGPALPWIQLLMRRIPTLSWDRFTQEMMNRFGDIIPQESRVPCNSSKHSSEGPIAAFHVAKNQPKIPPTPNNNTAAILPTVTAPLLSSSPPTTAQQEIPAINTSTNHPDLGTTTDNSAPLTLLVQHPVLSPVCMTLPSPTRLPAPVTAPLLSSSPDILQFQLPFLPLLQHLVPAAADHTKLMVSSTPPTTAMMTAPLLSASPDNLQIQSPFSSLLRCLVSAAHQSTPMAVSFPGSLFSSAGTPFFYLVMLRFLHIVGHLLWFNALATTRKHEFEPPPDKVIGFNFDLSLEGKAVLRVRQLIRITGGRSTSAERER